MHFGLIGNNWYPITSPANGRLAKQVGNLPIPVASGGVHAQGLGDRVDTQALLKAYHTWVFRAVKIIAENASKQEISLMVQRGDDAEEVNEHPLLEVLNNPNPIQTRFDLWELTWTYLELTGNSYWFKARDGLGVVRELWPIRPDLMKPVPDEREILKGYLWRFRGKEIAFKVEEIVHLMYPNPLSMWIGLGSLEAARFVFDTDKFMRDWNIETFKNKARPDGVLETDLYLQGDDIERIKTAWNKAYGGVSNAHRLAILQAGTKYKPLSLTPQQLDFLESQKASKADIFEMFGIPRAVAGIVEDVNRANAETSKAVFAENTILPKLCKMEARLTKNLAQPVDSRLFFKYADPVPEDREFKLKERESNLRNFITDVNEERAAQGLQSAPWGEGPWMPFNLIQFGGGGSADQQARVKIVKESRRELLFNPEFRLISWKQFDAISRSQINAFRLQIRRLFATQEREVLGNLRQHFKSAKDATIDFELFDMEKWLKKFGDDLDKNFKAAILAGAKKGIADIGAESEFDLNSPLVQAFLQDKEFKFTFAVNNTTEKKLRTELTAGLEADETIEQLSRRVQKVFGFADEVRAPRIAATEVNTSVNFGVHDAYRQSDIVQQKNWLSQRDGNVRDSHNIDFEIVNLSELFSNGLMYPGDPNGDASEIINCRCTTLPVVE